MSNVKKRMRMILDDFDQCVPSLDPAELAADFTKRVVKVAIQEWESFLQEAYRCGWFVFAASQALTLLPVPHISLHTL